MNLNFIQKLSFKIQKTSVEAQKIDGSALKTFGIIIAGFQIKNKVDKLKYFQKTFLMVNIIVEVVLKISFFKLMLIYYLEIKYLHGNYTSLIKLYLLSRKFKWSIQKNLLYVKRQKHIYEVTC